MLDWYPPTSDDVGPTAEVGGFQPPGRSGGVASSGHPVDGSAQVVEFPLVPLGLRGSIKSAGFRHLVRLGWFSVMCAGR